MTRYGKRDWTDSELLSRMMMREASAWREFHDRYDRLIYRCIHKVTGRFGSLMGSEDVQEIYGNFLMSLMAKDMHKLRCYSPERGNKLSSWIGLLATNSAWDYMRSLSRRPATTTLTDAEELRCEQADAHAHLLHQERWEMVNEQLRSFSSKDQDFVRLYFVDGLTPEEVAEHLQISVKTVYSKKHKIRCRLEQALAPQVAMAA